MTLPTWKHITAGVGSLLSFGFGCADLWHFHSMAATTDMSFLAAGLAVLGVTLASGTGSSSAS